MFNGVHTDYTFCFMDNHQMQSLTLIFFISFNISTLRYIIRRHLRRHASCDMTYQLISFFCELGADPDNKPGGC